MEDLAAFMRMDAFDRMSPTLRRALAESAFNVDPTTVIGTFLNQGEDAALRLLHQTEQDAVIYLGPAYA